MRGPLVEIVINDRPLPDVTDGAFQELVLTNEPPDIFVRHGRLVRVRSDEKHRPFVEDLSENRLRHHLARVAEFVRETANGKRTPVHPPLAVVGDVLALPSWPGLPALEALTEVPILRADGTVLDVPGYDAATALVYCPAPGLMLPPIPAAPRREDARGAIEAVADLFVDMPFTSRADFANLLALLITPIVRPAITGQVPLALVDKPKRGTGATLCVQVVAAIAFGSVTELTTAPHDDEEWRKKITAALVAGSTFLWFDKIDHKLTSPSLAAALTTPEWRDRILGKSEMTRPLPQRATWVATGNNLQLGGDLGRRSYRIRLDAGVARPWQRDGFQHPHLLRHVLRHRGELLAAILTAARAWFAADCPPADVPRLGSFEEWTRTVGGILAFAGVPGFLENLNELYDEVDEDEQAWGAFLAVWHGYFGEDAVTVATVAAAARDGASELRDALPADLLDAFEAKAGTSFSKRLGRALARRAGAVFDCYRLERHGIQHQAIRWRVTRGSFGSWGSFSRPFETSQSDRSNPPTTPKNSPDSPNSPLADGVDSELPL